MLDKRITDVSKPAVDTLIVLSKDPEPTKRASAIALLGAIGDTRAVQPLIDALHDRDSNVKREAIYALANMPDGNVIEFLITALNDTIDESVRKEVLQALDYNPDLRALLPLVRTFRDPNDEFPFLIKRVIWYINRTYPNGDVVETLLTALTDNDPRIRGGAARTLAEIDDMRAVEPLIHALRDTVAYVRVNAAVALTEMRILERIALFTQMAETFITDLQDFQPSIRQLAASILEQIDDDRAVPHLLVAIRDSSPSVRVAAVSAIGHFRDLRTTAALINCLNDNNWRVRKNAAHALAEIGDARAVSALAEALNDHETWVRTGALWALFAIKNVEAVNALISAANHTNEYVRRTAIFLLGKIGREETLDIIRRGLHDPTKAVQETAQAALYRLSSTLSGSDKGENYQVSHEKMSFSVDLLRTGFDELESRLIAGGYDRFLMHDWFFHISEILDDWHSEFVTLAEIFNTADLRLIPKMLDQWASGSFHGREYHAAYHLQELIRLVAKLLPEEYDGEEERYP